MATKNMEEHTTAISWDDLEKIRYALRNLHGMAYAVMVASDTEDIFTDAVAAVYDQATRARDLFETAAYPDER